MKVVAIIPARIASTRLPRKVLREIAGQTMLQRVYEAARGCSALADVIVATDSNEILSVCERNGWTARMTATTHRSGTDRVHEVAQSVAADVYINVQGDEPLAHPDHVNALVELMKNSGKDVGTVKTPCPPQDVNNPNAVKVVTDAHGRALYFSRSPIPHDREKTGDVRYFKHLGFYAYRKPALDRFCSLPESTLERSERLEQLRFLENGIPIYVTETIHDTIGVDTEDDLRRVEGLILARS
jgi:3-deoxy-manno-octulosonate cytidylyltransferase (CMP-KDO synthetase)